MTTLVRANRKGCLFTPGITNYGDTDPCDLSELHTALVVNANSTSNPSWLAYRVPRIMCSVKKEKQS
jgi:hypothetical protein